MAAMVANEREVDAFSMDLQQLSQMKDQFENELNDLGSQIELLSQARNKFLSATATVTELKTFPEEHKLMVPLNTSLYVPGTIMSTDKLLVELGTGYYCEKASDEALKVIRSTCYCEPSA